MRVSVTLTSSVSRMSYTTGVSIQNRVPPIAARVSSKAKRRATPPPGSALFGTSMRIVPYSPCQTLPLVRFANSFLRSSSKLFAKTAKADSASVLKSEARVKVGLPVTPIPDFPIVPTSFALMTTSCVLLSAMRSNSTFISSSGSARRDAGSPKSVYCSVPGIHCVFRMRLRKLILALATTCPTVSEVSGV